MTLRTKMPLLQNYGAWFTKAKQQWRSLRFLMLVPFGISLSNMRVFLVIRKRLLCLPTLAMWHMTVRQHTLPYLPHRYYKMPRPVPMKFGSVWFN